jgi:TrmH family RNA methyltransferase
MPHRPSPRSNRLLTLARDLQRRKARERNSLFVAEGVRVAGELVRASVPLEGVLVSQDAANDPRVRAIRDAAAARGAEEAIVTEAEFASAAATDAPQGVLAIGVVPDVTVASLGADALARVLVLDAVQDPGNVGTMIRTAAAFGARAVVALPGTADPWNAKVVRGAAGGHFHVIVCSATLESLTPALAACGTPLWGADAAGAPLPSVTRPARVALAVGNEGAGLTAALRVAVTATVALPMASGVESLNVGVAAGVMMYELFR